MTHASIREELLLDANCAPWDATATRGAAFEAVIAERLGARHAIAVASPTTAFQIAYRAAGVPLGATVLTSSLADPTVVRATVGGGLRPRFADVDARGHLAAAAVAAHAAIHGEPAVLVPSHFAGHPYDSRALAAAAPRALVIEDAIDALGAVHADGRPVGQPGHAILAVLGVRPAGAMAPAQGALLVTDDRTLA
ncbi:MAG: DegT/DnrJ/EryC1/StrS family aminotransferase, partial [Candidatus Binatia bacterium]